MSDNVHNLPHAKLTEVKLRGLRQKLAVFATRGDVSFCCGVMPLGEPVIAAVMLSEGENYVINVTVVELGDADYDPKIHKEVRDFLKRNQLGIESDDIGEKELVVYVKGFLLDLLAQRPKAIFYALA
jgi:hypothetical protein